MNSSIETESFSPAATENLTSGFTQIFEPKLVKVKGQLKELTDKQGVLVDQIHDINIQIARSKNCPELQDVFNTIKTNQTKLISVKKDMRQIHERSSKLVERVLKLRDFAEKDAYMRQKQKELEIKREVDLIPQPAGDSQ